MYEQAEQRLILNIYIAQGLYAASIEISLFLKNSLDFKV
jgi:hypothetical protein